MCRHLFLIVLFSVSGSWVLARSDVVERAETLFRAKKWQEARLAFEEALPQVSGNRRAEVYNRIGFCLERDGNQYDASIAAHRQALAIPEAEPQTRAIAYLRIGYALKLQRKFEEAAEVYGKIEELSDISVVTQAEGFLFRAWTFKSLDKPEQAKALFRKIIDLPGVRPSNAATAWHNLGGLYEDEGNLQEAIHAYEQVITMNGATHHQKGHAESELGELRMRLQGPLPYYIKPYVMSITGTSARLSWVSQEQEIPGMVTLDKQQASYTSELEQMPGTSCFRHVVDLQELTPGTRYSYTVDTDGNVISASFKTSPPKGTPVTFSVLGDTQSRPDIHLAVAQAIARDKPDVVLHAGDLTDRGNIWGRWRAELFEPAWPYMQQAVFAPAVGNHDGGPYYPRLFDGRPDFYYSFTYGDVFVVVLDSYWAGQGRSGRPKQIAWLKEALAATDAAWKIALLHVPMVATRFDLEWWGKDDFLPILEETGVDLVFVGHHPMYRRYLPIGQPGNKPVLHITSGGGGPVGDPVPSPILVKGAGLSHHTTVKVDGRTLSMVAKDPSGAVIDDLTLVKEAGTYQKEIVDTAIDAETAYDVRALYQSLLTDQSNDLLVGIDQVPVPGQTVTLSIDLNKLPLGRLKHELLPPETSLVIAGQPGNPWQIAEQEVALDGRLVTFQAIAPPKAAIGPGSFTPALDVVLNVKVGDRLLEPYRCQVRLRADAHVHLQANDSGLPVTWQFRLDPDDVGTTEKWFDPAAQGEWKELKITSFWEDQWPQDYNGNGWYRQTVTPPEIEPGNRLWFELGAADESVWLYVDGQEVAHQIFDTKVDDLAWQKPRRFDVTDHMTGPEHVVVIRVQDKFGMGGIYQGAVFWQEPASVSAAVFEVEPQLWDGHATAGLVLERVPGKYVDEKALQVDWRGADEAKLQRTILESLPAGSYQVSLRYRLNPTVPADDQTALQVVLTGADGPLAAFVLPALGSDKWSTVTRDLTIDQAQPVQLQLQLEARGQYQLDALSIAPAND